MNLQSLRRNLGYKALSLLIALVLYYVAYGQQNRRDTRPILVQPRVVNLSRDLVLTEPLQGRSITVSGYEAVLNALKPQDIIGQVDLSGVGAGVHNASIDYDFPPGVRGELLPQDRLVKVTLERKEAQNFAVDAFVTGVAPVGYEYAEGVAQPKTVAVRGTEEELARVARVVARVEAKDNEGRVERQVNVAAEDSQRRVVDGVEIDPPQVTVVGDLRRLPVRKRLVLSVDLQGEPADGFTVKDYRIDPGQVTVIGPESALSVRSSLDVPVDITGIKASAMRSIRLTPPPGLRLELAEPVQVQILVAPTSVPTPSPTPTPTPTPTPSPLRTPAPAPSASPPATPSPRPPSEANPPGGGPG